MISQNGRFHVIESHSIVHWSVQSTILSNNLSVCARLHIPKYPTQPMKSAGNKLCFGNRSLQKLPNPEVRLLYHIYFLGIAQRFRRLLRLCCLLAFRDDMDAKEQSRKQLNKSGAQLLGVVMPLFSSLLDPRSPCHGWLKERQDASRTSVPNIMLDH